MLESSFLPIHKQIYEKLRQKISDGIFTEGDILPSENYLCQIHQTTRPTVRKALERLSVEGYITRKQGKGSIVKKAPNNIDLFSFSGSISAIQQKNLTTKIIKGPEFINCETAFSFTLSAKEKEHGFLYLERLRLINNIPILFDVTLIPNINLPHLTQKSLESKSLFEMLRKNCQIETKGGEQKLLAITADERLQKFLNVKQKHPILQLNRKIATTLPDFYFYSQVFCNTENYTPMGTF